MKFDTFQRKCDELKRKPTPSGLDNKGVIYYALETAGEAGEVADEAKKAWRNDDAHITKERRKAMLDEYGDVLFAVAQGCAALGANLDDVAKGQIKKLERNGSSR